jgi:hypothetical protein
MGEDITQQHPDIAALDAAFAANARDARAVVQALDEAAGTWRSDPTSWSVAECLDHLAVADRVYLEAMRPVAERAAERGRIRRRSATPGLIGRWFVRRMEPPVRGRARMNAPAKIRPRVGPSLAEALARFSAAHEEVRAFLARYAELDLAGVRFPNPFVAGIRFSLATGIHVLAAHERRHLWQAWNVRRAAEAATAASDPRLAPTGAVAPVGP